MGKSDRFVFEEYEKILGQANFGSVAFLGSPSDSAFTANVTARERDFYDLSLGNWNINDDWSLGKKYDAIICTRCAYFSKEPVEFINRCLQHLNSGGLALVDWGLGDHWRFDDYKVGWVRNGQQEYAYSKDNFLHSCYWSEELEVDPEVVAFWKAVKSNPKFGYDAQLTLGDVVKKECPKIVKYPTRRISTKFLWPESPQLYIVTLIAKENEVL